MQIKGLEKWGWNQGRCLREKLSDPGLKDGGTLDERDGEKWHCQQEERKANQSELGAPLELMIQSLSTISAGHTLQEGKDHRFFLHQF